MELAVGHGHFLAGGLDALNADTEVFVPLVEGEDVSQRLADALDLVALQPPACSATEFSEVLGSHRGRHCPDGRKSLHSWTLRFRVITDGVPVELAAYGKGRILRDALEPADSTGYRL